MQTCSNTQLSHTDSHSANLALHVLCGPHQSLIMTILLLHPFYLPPLNAGIAGVVYCAWGLCPFFTLCVIVFNILLFIAEYLWVTSVSSYALPVFLTVTSSFEVVSLCILDGWSGTWCTVQAGLRRNPPASS